jgi:Zn-dependent M28 family amino/carboxypeptidase
MLANDNGAIGVIMVSGSSYDPSDELVNMSEKAFDVGIPVIQVSRNVADRILHTSGLNVSSLEKKFLNIRRPSSFAVKANVAARTDIILQKKQTQNVVGLIEGTDPLLKNQYIVIGAHYDHLGNGGKGSSSRIPDTLGVHNGADDNASGVSAILEVAQKFAGNLNKRSIVVVAFGAEEMGLLGSRFFIENPIIPIDSIVAMINVDMVGRMSADKALQVGGVKTSLESEGLIDKVNEVFKFNMAKSPEGYGPSDHASFYGKDIPVFFISTGAHVDYHTPNDKIDRINFEGLFETSQFIEAIVTELVSVSQKLTFQEAGPKSSPTRHGRDLKVKLGIMPDVSGATNDGLKVLAVTPNNPAFIAGIKKDDIITALNGQKVNNIHDYMFRLKDLKPGNTISVELKRNGEKLVVLVQL